MVSVASIDDLRSYQNVSLYVDQAIFVLGYTVLGDDGGGPFLVTTVSPGADNGGTIIHSDTSGYYFTRMLNGSLLTVEMFGAVGDQTTNDTVAIQSGIDYLEDIGGGILNLSTDKRYKIAGSGLTIVGNAITLRGTGQLLNASTIQWAGTTGNCVTVTGQYSGVENIYFRGNYGDGGSAPTSGYAIKFTGCYHAFARQIRIDYCFNAILVDNSTETRLRELEFRYLFGTYGVRYYTLTGSGASYRCIIENLECDNPYPAAVDASDYSAWATNKAFTVGQVTLANNAVYYCSHAGTSSGSGTGPNNKTSFSVAITDGSAQWLFICNSLAWIVQDSNSSSLVVEDTDCIDGMYGLVIQDTDASGSSYPYEFKANDLECDHNFIIGVSLTAGNICQISNGSIISSVTNNGVLTASNWLGGLKIVNSRIFGNAQNGIYLNAGSDTTITGCTIAANSQQSSTTYQGVVLGATNTRSTIVGNNIGWDFAGTGSQAYGVKILSGATQFTVTGNDLYGNATGGLQDQSGGFSNSLSMTWPNTSQFTGETSVVHAATAAGSYQILNDKVLTLTESGTIASYTVTLPQDPVHEQEVWIYTQNIITTFTLTPGSGQSISSDAGTISTMGARKTIALIYDLPSLTWHGLLFT